MFDNEELNYEESFFLEITIHEEIMSRHIRKQWRDEEKQKGIVRGQWLERLELAVKISEKYGLKKACEITGLNTIQIVSAGYEGNDPKYNES